MPRGLSLKKTPCGASFGGEGGIRTPGTLIEYDKKTPCGASFGGEGGIRTPGTLIEYDSLANCWFQPLTHLSVVFDLTKSTAFSLSKSGAKLQTFSELAKFFSN